MLHDLRTVVTSVSRQQEEIGHCQGCREDVRGRDGPDTAVLAARNVSHAEEAT